MPDPTIEDTGVDETLGERPPLPEEPDLDLDDDDGADDNGAVPPKRRKRKQVAKPAAKPRAKNRAMPDGRVPEDLDEFHYYLNSRYQVNGEPCLDSGATTIKLERISGARYPDGSSSIGGCEQRNTPYTEQEIIDRFGGGTYRLRFSVPQPDNKPPRNFTYGQNLVVQGPPKGGVTTADPKEAKETGRVERDLVGMARGGYDRLVDVLTKQPKSSGVTEIKSVYDKGNEMLRESMSRTIEAREQVANERVAAATQRVAESEQRLREMEQRLAEERGLTQQRIDRAERESSSVINAMIPQIADGANQQVARITQMFEAREARIQQSAEAQIQNLISNHRQQIDNLATLHQAELSRLTTSYEGQLQLLQHEVVTLRDQLDRARDDASKSKDRLMEFHVEAARKNDPIESIERYASVAEYARQIAGVGGGGEGGDLGEDAPPWMSMVTQVAQSLGPGISALIQRGVSGPPAAAAPQALPQPAPVPQVAPQPQPQPQPQQTQALVPTAASPVQRRTVRINLEELKEALVLLANNSTSTTPEAAAQTAVNFIARDTLQQITEMPRDQFIGGLRKKKLLGVLDNREGVLYVARFLDAVAVILAGGDPTQPAAEPAQTEPEQTEQPANEIELPPVSDLEE